MTNNKSPKGAKPAVDQFPRAPSPGAEAEPAPPPQSVATLEKEIADLKERQSAQEGNQDRLSDEIATLKKRSDKQQQLVQNYGNVAQGAETMAVRNEERLGVFESNLDRIGLSQHALEQRVELQTAAAVKNDNILAMHEKLDRLLCNKRRRSPTPPRRHSPSPVRTPREERSRSASPQPSAVSPAKTYDPEQRIKELEAIVANQATNKKPFKMGKRNDGAGPSTSRPKERAPTGSAEEMRRIMAATQKKQEAELKARLEKEGKK